MRVSARDWDSQYPNAAYWDSRTPLHAGMPRFFHLYQDFNDKKPRLSLIKQRKKKARILDAGCGDGRFVAYEDVSLDLSKRMLRRAKVQHLDRHLVGGRAGYRYKGLKMRVCGVRELVKSAGKFFSFPLLNRVITKVVAVKLKREINNCESISGIVEYVFDTSRTFPFDITPRQVKDEIFLFLEISNDYKPKAILEVGTANGGTFFLFVRIASADATIISLDVSGKRNTLYKSLAMANQKVHVITGNSHAVSSVEAVKQALTGELLDCLFIDGDHSYEGVKKIF